MLGKIGPCELPKAYRRWRRKERLLRSAYQLGRDNGMVTENITCWILAKSC